MGLIRCQTSTRNQQSMDSEYFPTGYEDDAQKQQSMDSEYFPTGYDDDTKNDLEGGNMNMSRSSSSSFCCWKYLTIAQYVVFIFFCIQYCSAHFEYREQVSLLSDATESYATLYSKFTKIETMLQHTHDDFTHLNFQLNSPRDEKVEIKTSEDRKRVVDSLIARAAVQEERIQSLKTGIQRSEEARLTKIYGKGPYAVEVIVVIEGERKSFIIQTAPSHIAPHAIRMFMDMVRNKFWDSKKSWDSVVTHYQVNHDALNVLLPTINMAGDRKESEYNEPLLFPESSPEFPHVANTICFWVKPDRSGFYINLDDNSDIHGPGGQADDHIHDGESCFGSIIHGIDVMEDFIKLNKKAMMSEEGVYYSAIKQMKFITIARRQ